MRCIEAIGEEAKLIGGDVEAVGISANVRIIPQTGVRMGARRGVSGKSRASMIGGAFGSVVRHRNAVDGPAIQRIAVVADRDIKMVAAGKRLRCRLPVAIDVNTIEREHNVEPALRGRIE